MQAAVEEGISLIHLRYDTMVSEIIIYIYINEYYTLIIITYHHHHPPQNHCTTQYKLIQLINPIVLSII